MSTHKRHIAKAITWRVVGTLDTILLSWLITGDIMTGLQIGGTELLTKMILYYLHERIWFKLRVFKEGYSQVRHLIKTFTWRFVGTLDTVFIAWFISGNAEIGLSIGGLELITKMVLYYLHERAWHKINFGLEQQPNNAKMASSKE